MAVTAKWMQKTKPSSPGWYRPVSGLVFIDPFSIRIPEVFHSTRFFTADAPIIFSGIFRNVHK